MSRFTRASRGKIWFDDFSPCKRFDILQLCLGRSFLPGNRAKSGNSNQIGKYGQKATLLTLTFTTQNWHPNIVKSKAWLTDRQKVPVKRETERDLLCPGHNASLVVLAQDQRKVGESLQQIRNTTHSILEIILSRSVKSSYFFLILVLSPTHTTYLLKSSMSSVETNGFS